MNVTNILRAFRELADDVGTPPLWSDTILTMYLAEAQMEATRRTRMLDDRDTPEICQVTVAPGTHVYQLDPRILFIRRVKASWQDAPLPKVDPRDLDRVLPGWEGQVNVFAPSYWMPWSDHKIRIENTAIAGTLNLWVVRDPLTFPHVHSPDPIAVTTLTRVGHVATVVLSAAPAVAARAGEHVTIAGADDDKWNGVFEITSVVDPTTFTFHVSGNPVTPAVGTITADIEESQLEIPSRYHAKLVDWMLYRALSMRDKEEKYDPKSAEHHLSLFEQEFGKRSSAIDETWIQRHHGYDDHEGLY